MPNHGIRSLKARWVFPVRRPPIRDGVITLSQWKVLDVSNDAGASDCIDLGNVAIVPGFINAHTHLELSDVDQPLGKPGMPITEWIPLVMQHRRQEGRKSEDVFRAGANACREFGTAVVGDIVQPDWSTDYQPRTASALKVRPFFELIGWTKDRRDIPINARALFDADHLDEQTLGAGLSPHAPYTVSGEFLRRAVDVSALEHIPLAMHLAETREEIQLLRDRSGPLLDMMRQSGDYTPEDVLLGKRPLDYLRLLREASRAIIIHGNYLDDEEIGFLARFAGKMSVAYCPRSHAYFQHDAYPLKKMLDRGVNVALGTDSLASSPDLNMLNEVRAAATKHPNIAAKALLECATRNGAQALGLGNLFGAIRPGTSSADITCVRLPEREGDPYDLLLDRQSRPELLDFRRYNSP